MRGAGPIGYPGGAEVVNMRRARLSAEEGDRRAALRRRRAAVGHLRLSLDPQRLARGGGGRRAGAREDRRPGADRPRKPAPPTCWWTPEELAERARQLEPRAATRTPKASRRGRRFSARRSDGSIEGMTLKGADELSRHRPQGRAARQSLGPAWGPLRGHVRSDMEDERPGVGPVWRDFDEAGEVRCAGRGKARFDGRGHAAGSERRGG